MRVGGGSVNVLLLALGAAGIAAGGYSQRTSAKEKLVFGRDILPILSDKCFKCHGPDAGSRMANLRLDTAEGAFADRGGKWAIVPGKPEDSLVVKRITHPSTPMPPAFSGKSLTPQEKELITRWIAEGAKYGKLWSFEPLPTEIPIPTVKGNWPRDDLDKFILARLNKEGLKPNREADRSRWLRRVTLDLTGLPPTPDEVSGFLADKSAGAFEKVVNRLLESPHFGERVAVDWLDAARYADSYGYQSDLLMPTWPYRDWVVSAFNKNLPYDQFLVEQTAGDELPGAKTDQILATAFNRLHRQSNEGGSIPLEFKTEYAVDRVDTFGTAVLGLTLGCARCHDHKFDPIRQKEYYQLFAYFNSISEFGLLLSTEIVPTPSLLLPTKDQEAKLLSLKMRSQKLEKELARQLSQSAENFKTWTESKPLLPTRPQNLVQFSLDGSKDKFPADSGAGFGSKLGKIEFTAGRRGQAAVFDGDNGLVFRALPAKDRWEPFTWSFWVQDPRQAGPVVLLHRTGGTDVGFCGFDLMLENGYLTARVMRHWPGNAVAIRTKDPVPKSEWTHLAWTWDGSGSSAGLKLYIDGREAAAEILNNRLWKRINAYGDLGPGGGDWTFGSRFRDAGFRAGKVGDIAFADHALCLAEIQSLYSGEPVKADPQYFLACIDEEARSLRAQIRKSQEELAQFEEGIQEISVMEDAEPEIPAYLLARGQYDAPRTEKNRVFRGVPESLPPLKTDGKNNRLALARWATQPDHPLTSRVAVNRLWQMVFGTGLVETSENFGVQGAQPTHPELLDFLARRFVNENWDVKKTLKHFVLSATYRQDSARMAPQNKIEKDPVNRLYARGPSGRLSAEMVRDMALAAAGLLNPKMGGPPVNAYQPAGIWQENNTMSPGFVQSVGVDLYRRSLYSTWKRTTPVPSMMSFDATSREACTVRRPSTNTPLQALVLLNDVQFVEAARVLAERVLAGSGNDEARIQEAFLRLAGRKADGRELGILMRTLDDQRLYFRAHVSDAARLIRFGDKKADPSLRPSELAAMTVTVQTILNSDAVIWKR